MLVLLVHINHFLYFVIASHEDTRSIMDVLGNNSKHPFHTAIYRLASSCFETRQHMRQWPIGVSIGEVPFSKTIAMGAHSYKILNFPFGLFLSAGYANIPPYNKVR